MIKQVFTSAELPAYHEGMLIVKMRSAPSQPLSRGGPVPISHMAAHEAGGLSTAPFTATREAIGSVLTSPAMSALAAFERGGLIKRIIPLSTRREEERVAVRAPLMRTFMSSLATASTADSPDSNAGVNILELERDSDVRELQIAFAGDPNVEFASRVPIRYLAATRKTTKKAASRKKPADGRGTTIAAQPPPASTMWNLRKINWRQARALSGFKEATDIRVAVLDTGIDPSHPDLAGRINSYTYSFSGLPIVSGDRDIIGHGTHVAGTIGAAIGNNLGINGICACRLDIWKIFDDTPDFASFAEGFVYYVEPVMYRRALADCLDEGVDVINLSIGGPGEPDQREQELFDALLSSGTTVVAAMGNEREYGSPISYPAAIPGVIAVGATSLDDSVAGFSNRGNHISLCAPGVAVWSTLPTYPGQFGFRAVPGPDGRPTEGKAQRRERNYDAWDGTSMASPHVAAAAALLFAKKGSLSPQQARRELMQKVDRVPAMGGGDFHPDYGTGRLNLLRLLS